MVMSFYKRREQCGGGFMMMTDSVHGLPAANRFKELNKRERVWFRPGEKNPRLSKWGALIILAVLL